MFKDLQLQLRSCCLLVKHLYRSSSRRCEGHMIGRIMAVKQDEEGTGTSAALEVVWRIQKTFSHIQNNVVDDEEQSD